MVRARILGKKERRLASEIKPFSKRSLRRRNKEAIGAGMVPLPVPPVGKTHFESVSKTVKRILGLSHPIVFIDDIISYSKVAGVEGLENIRKDFAKRYEKRTGKKPSSHQTSRYAYDVLKDLTGPGQALLDRKTLKCHIYVDKYATSSIGAIGLSIKTERDATDFKNSIVAHETGQLLYSLEKRKQGKQENGEVGEFIGRFFEFDYLLRKNPKFGREMLKEYGERKGQLGIVRSFSEDHNRGSEFVAEFFDKIKDGKRRRQLVRDIARRDFRGIGEVRSFVFPKA